ncbi:hydantoinase/oxoprolinase family protein [Halodesulfovibrio marinisediminis]|uniref:N-methylhydantoinase A/oxoprolinase/acetone carboxylase, beta subunit n=1 Tax=Halodesulfovibrio marinisediminis DSM 17456 TaxID=1121457 RepID=A0A1N6F7Y7_9BACT|nr:hydantoinase/oxoprolinase family protein [Halodesulfovibrio marinisediminis]SIN91367.1 N-methylhydantoinase A/oxoprolinase/acetone carboxylase, beta subunit [Halodesulfovibrio marinisediminis DSM 17456]
MGSNKRYCIGIDTGGTYTDAVIVELESGAVITTAKSPTTHYDIQRGIQSVVEKVLAASKINPTDIVRTSVSTTLATNALVENKGADVALFVIGFNQRLEVPAVAARFVPGGHTIKGEEVEPLGIQFIVDGVNELKNDVEAWAVCSSMAFMNPVHELVAAKAVKLVSDAPVFCSHEASSRAGMKERASTACLNAQLLPVMRKFLSGISNALTACGITGEVLVVRGDATAMQMQEALTHAASTIASGPAATALFGAKTTNTTDALILDVGGTTTDITLIKDGKPVVDTGGMSIGKWETHVEAVEMFTVGIGGDSLVQLTQGKPMQVGPDRVTPVCMAKDIPAPEEWIGQGKLSRCIAMVPNLAHDLVTGSTILTCLAEHGAMTPQAILMQLGIAEITFEQELTKLLHKQYVIEVGFTPTDALHVLKKLDIGDYAAAFSAAQTLAAIEGCTAEEFALRVLTQAERVIEETVLRHLSKREIGGNLASYLTNREENPLLQITVSLNVPMIGIGAAAPYLLTNVAKRLNTAITFPDHFAVGNALGSVFMAERNC